ncbi:WD40/YVTN/BNR-like repeat-containing protein [Flagellimonas myxillae]|uniref:WD40/YVTN/BNR-like repeat-containing protein n=1 Tax=Flagellimonas myxillae TaxID=2942214 RepID=UPI00201F182D|nr:oxidoreductase [Muricauda myxillae]MCL6265545.1 oxidoreductase [Muricauda myxillae]
MKYSVLVLLLIVGTACSTGEKRKPFTSVHIQPVLEDSVSIRAIEFLDRNTLAFAGSNGMFGTVDVKTQNVRSNTQQHDSLFPEFRAVAKTSKDFFMLSAGNPALVYKTGEFGKMELVYKEEGEGVFYDSMKFWDDKEGIAIGDTMQGCLSIILTEDGGKHWQKLPCSRLPPADEAEGAFAASNTNLAIIGDKVWIATTGGNVYSSGDRGKNWTKTSTPIVQEKPTEGIYSIDFYNGKIGFAIGGDYTQPESNKANKIVTQDGGLSWQLAADGAEPNYKSCVQFVPNTGGKGLVATGFTGISYSHDGGVNWNKLSDEGFYSLRFLNDTIAYASGKNRIAQLVFK